MLDTATRYRCWRCGSARWLPERPLSPSYAVPNTHHPVGVPGQRALNEEVRD